eukprot:12906455-Prorocentrum_lima.AAC.1
MTCKVGPKASRAYTDVHRLPVAYPGWLELLSGGAGAKGLVRSSSWATSPTCRWKLDMQNLTDLHRLWDH